MSFRSLDLNLLRVFDAVMAERSVQRASRTLNLTQSAVSHALARLRDAVGDPLFVRSGAVMEPTTRALEIAAAMGGALRSLEAAVDRPRFVPAASDRSFTVAASDFTTLLVVPPLLALLRQQAPSIDLFIKPVTRIDLAEQFDVGRIDVAIGMFSAVPPRFRTSELFRYDDVLVTCRTDCGDALTPEALARLPIAVVSYGGGREGAVDGFIQERGLARRSEMFDRAAFEASLAAVGARPRLAVSLPHFLALPEMLASSDLAAIVPRPLAAHFQSRSAAVRVSELPYPTQSLPVQLLWHERHEIDPAHLWLRSMLRLAATGPGAA